MKLFEKGELRILWPFYLEYFIASMLFFAPAFFVVYFSKLSLSFAQIGVLLAITPLTSLLFEIPTGAFADIYGRKASVLLGYLIEGICMLSFFFLKDYYFLLAVAGLWGIGMTFSSGSKDAWIVDMINKKDKKLIPNFFNKMQIFISGGLAISGLLGVFLVGIFGIKIIWIPAMISYFISITLLSIFAKEEHKKQKTHIKGSTKTLYAQSKETIAYGYKHHVLFYYLIATFLLMLAGSLSMQVSWTPFLKNLAFPDSYFGYLWTIMAFFSMLGPMASNKFLKKGKERNFIVTSLIITILITLLILAVNNWAIALLIIALFTFFIDLRTPASQVYFHRFIPGKLRATMGSIKSMIMSIGAILGTIASGYLVDIIGARYTILLYAPIAIFAVIFYLKIKEKK